jgi:L-cystine uptake protein TcyP (sodium:dicarboxylate symporter family)
MLFYVMSYLQAAAVCSPRVHNQPRWRSWLGNHSITHLLLLLVPLLFVSFISQAAGASDITSHGGADESGTTDTLTHSRTAAAAAAAAACLTCFPLQAAGMCTPSRATPPAMVIPLVRQQTKQSLTHKLLLLLA